MANVQIDWGSAEVHDGRLVVGFTEPPPPKWRKRAKSALALLERHGNFRGDVAFKKDRIVVSGFAEDGTDDVRHFLESIVQQAGAGEQPPGPPDGDDADERMTAAFRGFAADPSTDSE